MEKLFAGKSTSVSLGDNDIAYVEAKEYYGSLLAGMDKEMLPLRDVEGKDEGMAHAGFSFVDIAHEYDLTADLVFAYLSSHARRICPLRPWEP